jgi:DNA-binding CsgD family transcriptional regulator/tetratricopeptide (TPR) repeat protein
MNDHLFRRLAVFVGGFDLAAAEAVGAGDLEIDLLTGITSLVEQSLLHLSGETDPGPRYEMLETIREFGLEQVAAFGEEAAIRDAHADWSIALAERADPELAGPGQEGWFDQLEVEHPNLRSALSWLRERGAGERGLRLANALAWFWSSRGYLREADGWLKAFLVMSTRLATRGRGFLEASNIARWRGDFDAAKHFAEESLAILRECGDALRAGAALRQLAAIAIECGELEQASSYLAASSEIVHRLGTAWDAAFAIVLAGRIAAADGHAAEAMARFAEAAEAFRAIGDYDYVAAALAQEGTAALTAGDLCAARAAFAASVALAYPRNERTWTAWSLVGAARLAHVEGDGATAARLIGAATAIWEMIGTREQVDEAFIEAVRCRLGQERFDELWRQGTNLPQGEAVAQARLVFDAPCDRPQSSPPPGEPPLGLTPREVDVLRLVAAGLTDREIGARLFVSRRTVSKHVEAILAKLGVPARAGAVSQAARLGIV